MRIAQIENGVVINIIEGHANMVSGDTHVSSDTAGIGDTYANGVFTKPPTIDTRTPNEIVIGQIAEIEATITPRRLREAVVSAAGKTWLTDVESQIKALRATLV